MEGVGEPGTISSECVHVGSLDKRVTGSTQLIESEIVHDDHDDIGTLRGIYGVSRSVTWRLASDDTD
jgi:hypothetical protein